MAQHTLEDLRAMMMRPGYYRGSDPALIRTVTEGFKELYPEDAGGLTAAAAAANARLARAVTRTSDFSGLMLILRGAMEIDPARAADEILDLVSRVEALSPGHGRKLAEALAREGIDLSGDPVALSGGPDAEGGGVVHVDAYTQQRGGAATDVSAHTRSAPNGGGGGARPDVGSGRFYSPNGNDYYKSDGKVANGRPSPKLRNPIKGGKLRGGGAGHFDARRHGQNGYYQHGGNDVLAEPGSSATAAADGAVTAVGESTHYVDPETGAKKTMKYVEITTPDGYAVRQHYVKPSVRVGDRVVGGETAIGTVDDLAPKYGASMPNHTHVEVYDTETVVDNGRTDIKRFKRIDPAPHMGY